MIGKRKGPAAAKVGVEPGAEAACGKEAFSAEHASEEYRLACFSDGVVPPYKDIVSSGSGRLAYALEAADNVANGVLNAAGVCWTVFL